MNLDGANDLKMFDSDVDSDILTIIHALRANTGKNKKIEILQNHANNGLFQEVISAAMNPYRTYGIKQLPEVEKNTGDMTLAEFLTNLIRFEERTVTGNDARYTLKTLLETLSPDNAEVAKLIILKDLNCGIGPTIVNTAIPKLIPVYPCMKASSFSEKAMKKINYPALSQIKADGMRANMFLKGNMDIRSRSGKLIDLKGAFDGVEIPGFIAVSMYGAVLDGELRMVEDDGTWMSRKKGNGILNKAIKGTITEEEASRARFIAWDLINWTEFGWPKKKADENAEPYNIRWNSLKQVIKEIDDERVQLIHSIMVDSEGAAKAHYRLARKMGEEGTIVKNLDHPWEDRRSPYMVKIKAVEDCDLEIIGWKHGKVGGKWEHGLGSIVCASSDRKVEVAISGITDELREEIFENIDNYMGRIVAVEYNERIRDKSRPNVDSLFSPRFLELREDKDVADSSEDIK